MAGRGTVTYDLLSCRIFAVANNWDISQHHQRMSRKMDTVEKTHRKPSKMRRFLRSYFGRIVVALILIVVISSSIWWQTFAEYQKELRIAQRIEASGGSAGFGGFPALFYSFYPFRVCARINFVLLADCKKTERLLEQLKELRHLQHLNIRDTAVTDAELVNLQGQTSLVWLGLSDTKITDAGLNHLRGLDQLTFLSLHGTQISNSGLKKLSGMKWPNLRSLQLSRTQITDAGLEHLKGMNISELNLGATAVTDAGLEHLKGMTTLKEIRLAHARTTPSGQAELQKALPNCTIIP